MPKTPVRPPISNPFSTRFIRPGAIEYLFPPGHSAAGVVQQLAANGWRGQIVGPHGSGKSTLVAAVESRLRGLGMAFHSIALHDGMRALPRGWKRQMHKRAAKLLIIDGYEQLARCRRLWLRATCWWHDWGLLVTAHGDAGLPHLLTTRSDERLAQQVVRRLLAGSGGSLEAWVIRDAYAACGGDLRETLFRLYDVWEARNRRAD